jgi:hypothetical protein
LKAIITNAGGVNDDDALALFELGDNVVAVHRREQQHGDSKEKTEPRQPVTLRAETETNLVKRFSFRGHFLNSTHGEKTEGQSASLAHGVHAASTSPAKRDRQLLLSLRLARQPLRQSHARPDFWRK